MVEKSSRGLMVGTPSSTLDTKDEFLLEEEEEEDDDPEEPKILLLIGKVKTLSKMSSLRSDVGRANTNVFAASSAASKLLSDSDDAAEEAGPAAGPDAEDDPDEEATELLSSSSPSL